MPSESQAVWTSSVWGMSCPWLVFVVVYRLPNAHPDIHEAQPRDRSAYKAVGEDVMQADTARDQAVLSPDRGPRHDHQHHTHLDERGYLNDEPQPPRPHLLARWRYSRG